MYEALRAAGLTENDGKVYTELLKHGASNVSSLIEACGMHRKTIYDSLDRLSAMGLVSSHRQGAGRSFTADDPSRLMEVMKAKEELVKASVPDMLKLMAGAGVTTNVAVFKGKQGLVTIFEDIIKSGAKTWNSIIASGKAAQLMPEYVHDFHQRRVKAGVKFRVIYYQGWVKFKQRVAYYQRLGLTDVRVMPQYSMVPISIWVYKNKTALMIWDAETGILIEDENVSRAFKDHFEMLWKTAKPV